MAAAPTDARFNVFQIIFDDASRALLDPAFIPLDNTVNERPDWFEFWVIRQYLRSHALQDGAWYGFLSPRFTMKTGVPGRRVLDTLKQFDAKADVALFSPEWDQLAYFQSPFEQGDAWHPGLLAASQTFLDEIGYGCDLKKLVTHASTSVFANYLIAKPAYWREWLKLADAFFEYVEYRVAPDSALRNNVSYGARHFHAPMKTFVQERFASLILATNRYQVLTPDLSANPAVSNTYFDNTPHTRRALQACDLMKQEYCRTGDAAFLNMFHKLRAGITFKAVPAA